MLQIVKSNFSKTTLPLKLLSAIEDNFSDIDKVKQMVAFVRELD